MVKWVHQILTLLETVSTVFDMGNNSLINLFPGLRIYMLKFLFYFPCEQPCECPSSPYHPQLLPGNLFMQVIVTLVTICDACSISSVHFS